MSRSLFSSCVVAAAILAIKSGHAATVTVPNRNADLSGNQSRYTVLAGTARTLQLQVAASQLQGMPVGSRITGLAFRLTMLESDNSLMIFEDWDLTLAQAAHAIEDMSTTFADNMVEPVQVRSGPLSIAARSYPTGLRPDFGPPIAFSTLYTYAGGDLVVHLTHTGMGLFTTHSELDATNGSGHGTDFRSLWALGYNATTSEMDDAFTITQISFVPVPEPTSLVLCSAALGIAFMIRRRFASRV